MNEYQVEGEGQAIKAYNIILKITGDDKDFFDVTVSTVVNGAHSPLTLNNQQLAEDGSMTVQGQLPQPLKITRTDDCEIVKSEYGTADQLSYFTFNTKDAEYPDFAAVDRKTGGNKGRYCLPTDIKNDDGDVTGTEYNCW
jgi:hypothetical protein